MADAVWSKTGRQSALVEELRARFTFKTATPNRGHLLTAALLGEGAIASVVTLNFDLALSTAIAQLGVADVGVIEGPEDLSRQLATNLYYLHRNVNAADPEKWVLRTAALQDEWRNSWQALVTNRVFSNPVVVFVGLGSPAAALVEGITLIRGVIPDVSKTYQVGPGDPAGCLFFAALGIDVSAFLRGGWCAFAEALAARVTLEQTMRLRRAADELTRNEGFSHEDLAPYLDRLNALGLVAFGHARSSWLLHQKPYAKDDPSTRELCADLLLAVAMIARISGAVALLTADGLVEYRRGDRVVASYVLASGRGTRGHARIEAMLSTRRSEFDRLSTQPVAAIVAGVRDSPPTGPPLDVLIGEAEADIVYGPSAMPLIRADALRQDPAQISTLVP